MKKIALTFMTTLLLNGPLVAMELTHLNEDLELQNVMLESLEEQKKIMDNSIKNTFKTYNEELHENFKQLMLKKLKEEELITIQMEEVNKNIKSLQEQINLKKQLKEANSESSKTEILQIENPKIELIEQKPVFSTGTILSKEVTDNALNLHTTIYKALCENDANTILMKVSSIKSVKIIDSIPSKVNYLTTVQTLGQLEKDFMNTDVIEVTTHQDLTTKWTLCDLHMAIIGGFSAKNSLWDGWVNTLKSQIIYGVDGEFLRPLTIAKIPNVKQANRIAEYINDRKLSKKEALVKDVFNILGNKKKLKENNKDIEEMIRSHGIQN